MTYLHRFVLVSTLVATVTSASAQSTGRYGTGQSHGFRYDTVTIPDVLPNDSAAAAHKVIIIDNRTGDLWAWSEAQQTVMYLGYIFPLVGQGPIARVITLPEQR